MMTEPIDPFSQLPHLTWRDELILPVADRNHEFEHQGAEHAIIYRNGVAVEMTGAGARILSYTIPMREGITKGPYGGLFTQALQKLWASFYSDRTPGPLYDPIYGLLTCVPQRWHESTDVNKRDGVELQLSWKVHTPDEGSSETASPSLYSLEISAQRLDEEVARTPWPVQQNPPEPTADPLSVASGVVQQGNYAVTRSKAKVSEVAMRMGEVEDAAEEAEANGVPGAGFVRQDARRARLGATKVANAPPRETATAAIQVVTSEVSDLPALAKRFGMTLQDLLFFNPGLSKSVVAPSGSRVWVRRRK